MGSFDDEIMYRASVDLCISNSLRLLALGKSSFDNDFAGRKRAWIETWSTN